MPDGLTALKDFYNATLMGDKHVTSEDIKHKDEGSIEQQEKIKKIKRRIIDYMHKYATEEQIMVIARILQIRTD